MSLNSSTYFHDNKISDPNNLKNDNNKESEPKYSQRGYNDLPMTKTSNISYTSHFLSNLNSIDNWDLPYYNTNNNKYNSPSLSISSRRKVSVDVVSILPLKVIDFDGGDHGTAYSIENLISPFNNVYCARKNHCTAVFAIQSRFPMVKEINIVSPPQSNYTSPVQNVAIFMSMFYDESLIKRANEYIEKSPIASLFKSSEESTPSYRSSSNTTPAISRSQSALNFQAYLTQMLEEGTFLREEEDESDSSSTTLNIPAFSQELTMEQQLMENFNLFQKELDPKFGKVRRPSNADNQRETLLPNNNNQRRENTVTARYHLCHPSYNCDPQTYTQTINLAPQQLRVRNQQKQQQQLRNGRSYRNSCRYNGMKSFRETELANRYSNKQEERRARIRRLRDGQLQIQNSNNINNGSVSGEEESQENTDNTNEEEEKEEEEISDLEPDSYLYSEPEIESEDDDEESDSEYIHNLSGPTNSNDTNEYMNSYKIRTRVSESKWESEGPLEPIALATIPTISNTKDTGGYCYRHLRVRFSEPVLAKYLIVKFSNISTRGDTNVDIESLTVHGIESDAPSIEMI